MFTQQITTTYREFAKVNGKYLYLCVILDLFSRKVVAHRVLPKNSPYLAASTFRQEYRNRNKPQ